MFVKFFIEENSKIDEQFEMQYVLSTSALLIGVLKYSPPSIEWINRYLNFFKSWIKTKNVLFCVVQRSTQKLIQNLENFINLIQY